MQNFRLLTAQVKFHQICSLIATFLKVHKVSAKESVEELCLMIPKSHIVNPPPLLSARGLSLQPNVQKGGT